MKKVIVIQGTPVELGQYLTNLFGMNSKLKVHQTFTSTGIRAVPQPGILTAGTAQASYEPITVIILVYENPGELEGIGTPQTVPVTGKLKDLKN